MLTLSDILAIHVPSCPICLNSALFASIQQLSTLYRQKFVLQNFVHNNRPEGPLDKEHYHLPDYVVVDFPNLKLPPGIPPWDPYHKTVSLTLPSSPA